jgi:hypothetical protein
MRVLDLIDRVRKEIGDPLQPFLANKDCDGTVTWFDLPNNHIDRTTFNLLLLVNGTQVPQTVGTDYTIDYDLGQVTMTEAPPDESTLIATGHSWAMMDNDELSRELRDAVNWHTYNQRMTERYRDRHGFITYRDAAINLANLPSIEDPLVIMRGTINVFWTLANDSATDIDVTTGEGTTVSRGSRHESLMRQIAALEDRYAKDSLVLNVGPYRMEVGDLRRVSQTTGRLVPLFKAREYDDHRFPVRKLPPIDSQYEDQSGVPGQFWYGGGL